ncbi:hypothetical protein [Staphylococcus pettenkoferi]|uniref:hypothetical protein n=1 Tax=Staphylococcus pettenkoferi TaxID=170573 RepID=UPI0025522345|nr:hypothetical protein [Staphylococcus pettenkoferi]MDK7284331.1 hypothetical protein [Staphylococcus pettenkoferi]
MTSVINRVVLIKPSFFKASTLLIAKMAIDKLKNNSMYQEAEVVSNRISGDTSIQEAYRITSEFVKWKNHEK